MAHTRIVLAALPTMLADIVRYAAATHPDLEIVAQVDSRADLPRSLAETAATAAIVGLASGESPTWCPELLRARPGLTLLAVSADGRTAYRCEMRLQVAMLSEFSAAGLLAALRPPAGVDPDLHLFSLLRSIPSAGPTSES